MKIKTLTELLGEYYKKQILQKNPSLLLLDKDIKNESTVRFQKNIKGNEIKKRLGISFVRLLKQSKLFCNFNIYQSIISDFMIFKNR